jgi:glycosyltransferase involved in cell wall biosynthesis
MRVLLLVSELEDYTISFVNGVARHVPVTLGVPSRRYEHLLRWFEPAVDVRLLNWPRHSSLSNLSFLISLTKLIRRERPSLVHLLSNTTLWLNFAAPFWRPIPLITTVHDVRVHPGDRETRVLPSWATNLIVRQSNHVVVHGDGLRLLAIDQFAKAPDHVHVLSHPAIPRYAELARAEGLKRRTDAGQFTVLLFGRIFAYKGLEQLIMAEARLDQRVPNLRIVIAGRGDDPWSLRHLMGDPNRYEVRNRFIDDAEVAQLFLDADVVVLPYEEASQSGVLNLAAAFGKPTVVTDVGEFRATVEPHCMGLVVAPKDPESLGKAIALLAERPELRAKLGDNARAWAEGANAPETVGARAAELYRAIARQDRQP